MNISDIGIGLHYLTMSILGKQPKMVLLCFGKSLPVGKYELEEISSPYGYLIANTPLQFEIASNVAYKTLPDGNTPVITVVQNDISVKGKISVEKRGEVLVDYDGKFVYEEKGLPNATYQVYAKEDIFDPCHDGTIIYEKDSVVDTIVTTEERKRGIEGSSFG